MTSREFEIKWGRSASFLYIHFINSGNIGLIIKTVGIENILLVLSDMAGFFKQRGQVDMYREIQSKYDFIKLAFDQAAEWDNIPWE